jgi:putative transposase
VIVHKRQKNVTGIEDQILALYAKGVSCRDIQDHLQQLYGLEVSPTFVSNVTDKVLPQIRAWQSRPLAPVYALMFLDAIHFKVRQEGRIVSKAAYVVIGVDLEGMKEVLGIWMRHGAQRTCAVVRQSQPNSGSPFLRKSRAEAPPIS